MQEIGMYSGRQQKLKKMNTFTADGLNTLLHEAEEIMEGWTDTNE